jgi:predicted TIM-barrel fold metal-dependent hydrolase
VTQSAVTDVVDAHAHLLDTQGLRYQWIDQHSPALTALLENYYDIARDYSPRDYRADVDPAGVTASVACEFGAADGVAEAAWVQRCHDETGTPDAFIAAVDLCADDLDDRLARYRDLPVVRAVRQPLYWADDPLTRLGARPDYLTDTQWLRGFERVADSGLVWDLLLYAEQLGSAEQLLDSFPNVPIVLEAVGWPLDRSAAGVCRWQDALTAVAQRPNVTLKLQGLALLFGPSEHEISAWVRAAIEIFGADRCMFATHLPVDGLLWTVTDLLEATEGVLDTRSTQERDAYLAGTARRIYLSQ